MLHEEPTRKREQMKSDIVTLKYGKVYPLRTRSCKNDRIVVSRTQSENQKGC